MKISKTVGVLLLIIILTGCDKIVPEPTIDTTSDESMKKSSQVVRESLPENEREEFDEALQLLVFSQIDLKDLFVEDVLGSGNLESKIKGSLHGKTALQVISKAARIRIEREARERQQALDEIKELEQKEARERQQALDEIKELEQKEASERQQALDEIKELEQKEASEEDAREQLKKFKVVRSRFYLEDQPYSGKQPIIEITVKNGTDVAVSRAYFEGTLASPNRSVPWHKDSFNYSISGGLEPGEKQSWHLAPNMFSDWGKVDAPADAIFTVTVENIDGPDGKALYSTRGFTERDKDRLAELKEKYGIQ